MQKNKAMIVFYRNDKNEDIFLKEATPSVKSVVCSREDFSTLLSFVCSSFSSEKNSALFRLLSVSSAARLKKQNLSVCFREDFFDFSPCALSREKLLFFEMKKFFERSNASPCLLLVFLTRDKKEQKESFLIIKTRESSLLLFFQLCQKIEENF